MTNEQARRLDAAIAKAGLNWWEVQRQVGFDVFNDVVAIEVTIAAIEKMAKTEEPTEEIEAPTETETPTERKCFTVEDVERAIYTMDQWSNDGSFSAEVGQEVSEEVYFQMFNAMPPLRLPRECGYLSGFRMGEPYTHEQSEKTGEFLAHYAAFGKRGGKYYFLGHLNKYGEMCSTDKRENLTNRAIIYASGDKQGEQFGACIEYAKKHNLKVINRTTSFDIVAEKIVSGEIDMLLVYDYSRLPQNTAEYGQMANQLRGYGVTIIAAN